MSETCVELNATGAFNWRCASAAVNRHILSFLAHGELGDVVVCSKTLANLTKGWLELTRRLHLDWWTSKGKFGLILHTAATHTRHLVSLHVDLEAVKCAAVVIDLLKYNPGLEEVCLGFEWYKQSALVEALRNCPRLRIIGPQKWENADCAAVFLNSLQHWTQLEQLDFYQRDDFSSADSKLMETLLSAKLPLKSVTLVADSTVLALIAKHPTLTQLAVESIGGDCLHACHEALNQLPVLDQLSLTYTHQESIHQLVIPASVRQLELKSWGPLSSFSGNAITHLNVEDFWEAKWPTLLQSLLTMPRLTQFRYKLREDYWTFTLEEVASCDAAFLNAIAHNSWPLLRCFELTFPLPAGFCSAAASSWRNITRLKVCIRTPKPWHTMYFRVLLSQLVLLETAEIEALEVDEPTPAEQKQSADHSELASDVCLGELRELDVHLADDSLFDALRFPALRHLTLRWPYLQIKRFDAVLARMPALEVLDVYFARYYDYRELDFSPRLAVLRSRTRLQHLKSVYAGHTMRLLDADSAVALLEMAPNLTNLRFDSSSTNEAVLTGLADLQHQRVERLHLLGRSDEPTPDAAKALVLQLIRKLPRLRQLRLSCASQEVCEAGDAEMCRLNGVKIDEDDSDCDSDGVSQPCTSCPWA